MIILIKNSQFTNNYIIQEGNFQPSVLIIPKKDFPIEWYKLLKSNAVPVNEYNVENFLMREYYSFDKDMFKSVKNDWTGIVDEIHDFVQWGYEPTRFCETIVQNRNWGKNSSRKADHGIFDPLDAYNHFMRPNMEGFLILNSYDKV